MGLSYRLGILQHEGFMNSKDRLEVVAGLFETFRLEYLKIPFDTRLTLFNPTILYYVETAYINFEAFRRGFSFLLKKTIAADWEDAVKKLRPDVVKETIDTAINNLKDEVPSELIKSITENK